MKTTIVGILQIVGALAFVAFKISKGLPFTESDTGGILLALSSGYKGLVSQDAK